MSNEQWLDGYRWALTHLNDAGVINDAATYLAAGVNDTAVPTRTTATADPFVSDESKGADSPSAPAPAVSTTPTCNHPSPDLGRFKQDVCHACGVLVVPTPTGPEREATPPAPAVDDEPGVGAVVRDTHGNRWIHGHLGWGMVGFSGEQGTERWETVRDLMPPAVPEPREDAVEALARVVGGDEPDDLDGEFAHRILAALDRGAVPGYGPTGDRSALDGTP